MEVTAQEEKENIRINERLQALYEAYTPRYLAAWSDAFGEPAPSRINEFGIIDPKRYHQAQGILFIGRETNGWSDQAYARNCLFRSWMCDISRNGIQDRGHISRHPNMWYNIGRWALFLQSREPSVGALASVKEEAIDALGTIAFTNVNKVRGKNKIGREYQKLAGSAVTKELLQKEVEIITPKVIVACGTWWPAASILPDYEGRIIDMNHPGARKSTEAMLRELKRRCAAVAVNWN